MRITRIVATLAAPLLPASLSATPVHAETDVHRDPADAAGSPTDIRRVKVRHTDGKLITQVKFTNLRRGGLRGDDRLRRLRP